MSKFNYYFTASILLILSSSCADEVEDILLPESSDVEESYWDTDRSLSSNLQSISTYVKSRMAKLGHTRAEGSFTISPYIYEGDTVMYVVNYGEGWDIFSNDVHSRLVLFTSENGSIDLSDSTTFNPSLKTYIDATAEELLELKRQAEINNIPDNPEWNVFQPILSTVPENTISVTERAASLYATGNRPGPGVDGEWVLLQVQRETTGSQAGPLTQTLWGQDFPWNVYSREERDGSLIVLQKAGCGPVAVGQYLYYYHFLIGHPMNTITDVSMTSNSISFSGCSSIRWGQMALTNSVVYTPLLKDYVARYLGYLANRMHSYQIITYREEETETNKDSILSYLETEGFSLSERTFDFDVVKSLINDRQIVLTGARGFNGGHIFIIDKYVDTETTNTFIYGWNGCDQNGNSTVDSDGDPNDISSYTYISTQVHTNVQKYVYMNWGWDGSGNDVGCAPTLQDAWLGSFYYDKLIFVP